ncbi:OmpH family outer membrane protein [Maribellus mangrovi]|uniref:OmpH family outer membrane protein n=1 Tax=Maribellus mangrovi TaxID=3133146 RepID=UPI0030ED64DE
MRLRILLVLMLFFAWNSLFAQSTLKIGHVNVQELVQKHPDTDSIHGVIELEAKDMEDIYTEMLEEQQEKMETFEAESAGYSDFMRKTKQEELLALSQKIQTFNQTAQQQIRQHNIQLLQPVYDEVNSAIKKIAQENKFTYVLDISAGTVAYISPDSEDITARVLEELNK